MPHEKFLNEFIHYCLTQFYADPYLKIGHDVTFDKFIEIIETLLEILNLDKVNLTNLLLEKMIHRILNLQ